VSPYIIRIYDTTDETTGKITDTISLITNMTKLHLFSRKNYKAYRFSCIWRLFDDRQEQYGKSSDHVNRIQSIA